MTRITRAPARCTSVRHSASVRRRNVSRKAVGRPRAARYARDSRRGGGIHAPDVGASLPGKDGEPARAAPHVEQPAPAHRAADRPLESSEAPALVRAVLEADGNAVAPTRNPESVAVVPGVVRLET